MLLVAAKNSSAQKNKSDSIYRLLTKSPGDRSLRHDFMAAYRKFSADSALMYGERALKFSLAKKDSLAIADWYLYNAGSLDALERKQESKDEFLKSAAILRSQNDTFLLDDALNSLGFIETKEFHFKQAKDDLEEANAMRIRAHDTAGLAGNLLNIGYMYGAMGDYPRSLEYYYKALDWARLIENKDPTYMGKVLNNLGSIYMDQKKYKDAIGFFRQALIYKKKLGNKNDLASTYNNIGSNFMEQKQYDSALYYFRIALDLREQTHDSHGLAIIHNNVGQVFEEQGQLAKAEEEYRLALDLRESINDKNGILGSLTSLGKLLCKTNRSPEGISLLRRANDLAVQEGALSQRYDASLALAKGLNYAGQYQEGLQYSLLALDLKDSILNVAADENAAEMKARYDLDQSTRAIEKLKQDQKETALKNNAEQSRMLTLLISGSVVAVLIILFFFVRVRENRKARRVLQLANDEIGMKNKNITDSINYAKHIQLAVLPEKELLTQYFPDSFVLYKPKDIVSGDFFWIHPSENKIWFAVADCTGHGVPGAFMSVLGSSQLTNAVTESPHSTPSEILHRIDHGIRKQLHQDKAGSGSRDGMDIALCTWDQKKRELIFAGANRPVIIYRNTAQLEFLLPQKTAIGGMVDEEKNFSDQCIVLEKNNALYLYTDGFPDQFGGPKGKKFKSAQFRDLLVKFSSADMEHTGMELDQMFDEWKGELEQVDDVCVLGIRF